MGALHSRARSVLRLLALGLLVALIAMVFQASLLLAQEADEEEVVPPDPYSDDIVERGAYLVRVEASCVRCHGAFGFDEDPLGIELTGGFQFDMPFGVVYAPNLTLLGDWEDEDIEHAIRYGLRLDGEPLLPPMPYTLYEGMADDDMQAIIAYLRTLEPEGDWAAPPEFEDDLTRDMIRAVPDFDPDAEFPYPDDMDEDLLVRGTYIATRTAGCLACHGVPDENGGPDPDGPAAGVIQPLFPSLLADDLEDWEDEHLRGMFSYLDAFAMPTYSFQYLVEEDIDALVAWLRSQPSSDELGDLLDD
jgi:mono/diheme cytochrome c family protein